MDGNDFGNVHYIFLIFQMFINYFIHIMIIVKIENAFLKLPLEVDSYVYTRIYMSCPM